MHFLYISVYLLYFCHLLFPILILIVHYLLKFDSLVSYKLHLKIELLPHPKKNKYNTQYKTSNVV